MTVRGRRRPLLGRDLRRTHTHHPAGRAPHRQRRDEVIAVGQQGGAGGSRPAHLVNVGSVRCTDDNAAVDVTETGERAEFNIEML